MEAVAPNNALQRDVAAFVGAAPERSRYFLASLYAYIEALKIFFGIHPKAYRSSHRALSNRFPLAIY
ncbi:MAG: hypothetical protein FGM15_09445 [Chthoniobacterales bacterium]|nr:hypothetical protein [Chthoniobacterales bacterium]